MAVDGSEASTFWASSARSRLAFLHVVRLDDPPEVILQRADREFNAAAAALLMHRRRRNASSLISRLPPEILAHIFSILAKPLPTHRGRPGWVQVTWVCSQWRTVALEYAPLWHQVSFGMGRRWSEAFLSRAKSVPIHIDIDNRPEDSFATVKRRNKLTLKHISHAKKIYYSDLGNLCDVGANLVREWFQKLTTPAPLLEDLCMGMGFECSMPQNLFNQSAPMLRHVNLVNVIHFPWRSSFLRNLVTLNIMMSPGRTEGLASSLGDVLDFLEQSPTLERLHLINCLPHMYRTRPTPRPDKTVLLQRLAYLILSADIPTVLFMLKHLSVPHSATIKLGLVRPGQDSSNVFRGIFSALSGHLSASPKPDFHVEFICNDPDEDETYWELQIKTRRYADGTLVNTPLLVLSFRTISDHAARCELMHLFCDALDADLGNLRYLQVRMHGSSQDGGIARLTQQDWVAMLRTKDDVRAVYAEGASGAALCQALAMFRGATYWYWHGPGHASVTAPPPVGRRVHLLPKLSSLILQRVDFDHLVPAGDGEGTMSLQASFCQHLKARHASGTVLETLRLRGCTSGDWNWLEGLKREGIVRSVDLLEDLLEFP
ncbi:hypothetical protein BV25DRAFT_1823988 [Artomyces pyxidatus]|uniref:Uncharacterized protein n=1 Tax=Artomyces pyxidatus TaxID=48021 RepID=A0ACB8T6Q0_9AGAM|nr:hypothetical protein BV25DRAFT_1823988 [Artomyces pyxidatus]